MVIYHLKVMKMKRLIFFTALVFLTANLFAQQNTPIFTKVPKTGVEASIDSAAYKIDVALGRAESEAEKQLYKYVSSRFVDEFIMNGGISGNHKAIGVAYKLNFPFGEWKYGEANAALFLGANYGGAKVEGYKANTNFHLMLGHIIYPFNKRKLFLETSVFAGLNTFWAKGSIHNNELQTDKKYNIKRHRLIGGVYGKFGYYTSDRVGLFVNAMLPIQQANEKYMVSNSNNIFSNNPETPMLFGIGLVVKPNKRF